MAALTFAEFRRANVARCLKWQPAGLNDWSYDDWAIAVGGELGEALNVVKKLNRDRDGLVGNTRSRDELLQDLADEIADTVIYLDLLLASVGFTFFDAGEGMDSFGDLRIANALALANSTAAVRASMDLSRWGRRCLRAVGKLTEIMEGEERTSYVLKAARNLLGMLEFTANAAGIDLGSAVVSKWNRTSEKRGFPDRLETVA